MSMARSPSASCRLAASIVPKLASALHKGQCGKVGVVGGSVEYTGAPYYAAFSALKAGADLAHVFCTPAAATAIKSYSPELIVHGLLDGSNVHASVSDVSACLKRLSALVIGPGLGRDDGVHQIVTGVMEKAKEINLPLVMDGGKDGIFLVEHNLSSVQGYTRCVLTPNVNEFRRLCKAVADDCGGEEDMTAAQLARALGGVTIVRKGNTDQVSNGKVDEECAAEGSLRRCGGQGDVLAGSLGTFLSWASASGEREDGDGGERQVAACIGACHLVRGCAKSAFQEHKRGTTTVEIIKEIPKTFYELFDADE